MDSPGQIDDIVGSIDVDYLVNATSSLARIPTDVPMGFETLIEGDHPKLVHYVQEHIRPRLTAMGAWDLIDTPLNNLVVRTGAGSNNSSLIILNYTPAQHNNLMEDPFSGKVALASEFGIDQPAIFGQGVSQNKVHQAVMLTVLKLFHDLGIELSGRLFWAVNNEGRSSHECTNAILDTLEITPDFGVIQIPTEFAISLGNRGRIDIDVLVEGEATHSSAPESGLSAIDGAAEVVHRLRRLTWDSEHPLLGGRHAVVYKVKYQPVAPHTLPSQAHLTIDRRLLPGDELNVAVDEVRQILDGMGPYRVIVTPGVYMLPALVDLATDGLEALRDSHSVVFGASPEEKYFRGSFDAAGLTERGIPTVMYGGGGGVFPLGPDFVTIEDAKRETEVLTRFILNRLA